MDKQWYVLRVQSGRENAVKEALERRVKMASKEELVSSVLVPSRTEAEIRAGKKRITRRKTYPGYIMVEMELNDDTWFLIRETPGTGDFLGTGARPVPMQVHEVERIIGQGAEGEAKPEVRISFRRGDGVKVKEGPFENFDGVVEEVIPAKGLVRVIVTIFGRATPVELEYWQVEAI